MLNVEMFTDDKRVINIFHEFFIQDDDNVLEALEMYKFLSNAQIVQRMNELLGGAGGGGYPFISGVVGTPFKFVEDYRYTDLLVYSQPNSRDLLVVLNGLCEVNLNSLMLSLSNYSLVFVRVTPLHFKQLLNSEYEPVYDAQILFRRLLLETMHRGATDLHFDVLHEGKDASYVVRCRVDTRLLPIELFKLNKRLNAEMIVKLVERDTSVTSVDLNSDYGITAQASNIFSSPDAAEQDDSIDVALRISANRVLDGYHYVIRLQQRKTFTLALDALGFEESVRADLRSILHKHSGVTLITGAIRTGKNTTAFALLHELLKDPIKIVSYESPIEVLMPFTQINYNDNIQTLLENIKLAKKQDINIAYLNEIPNKEVAFAVQDLANSSIHVMTTMHMDRVWHLPYKLKEYYGESYKDVISQINGVFNQKMFAVSCPHCQEKLLISELEDSRLSELFRARDIQTIKTSVGCEHCDFTGEQSGVNQPYVEHVLFTDTLKQQLLRCDQPYQMEQILYDYVHTTKHTLEDYVVAAIRDGRLKPECAYYLL